MPFHDLCPRLAGRGITRQSPVAPKPSMRDPKPPATPSPTPSAAPRQLAKDDRLRREAAALRANLLKRKAQARARSEAADKPRTG